MNSLVQLELVHSDAGFEEDGIGDKVCGDSLLVHETKVRDCLVEVTHISKQIRQF